MSQPPETMPEPKGSPGRSSSWVAVQATICSFVQ
jgi:hypothetical protein